MAAALRRLDLSAPEILHADLDQGLILMEDLGNEPIVAGDPLAPVEERYAAAVEFLVSLHARNLPTRLSVTAALDYSLPFYDIEALLIEAELLLDWYLIKTGAAANETARAEFVALWQTALAPVLAAPATWVLRDFHSPNLLWLAQRKGIARVGLVDFQDALIGPAAYDVASLLQDARVDVPEELEMNLLGRYVRMRLGQDRAFDTSGFTLLYATLAAQRATKVLGIFARLQQRDGKPQYLRHMPRLWNYLQRSLAHPALTELKAWYAVNVPPPDGL
jgi:aminoglycoside/choline kinase family phosphotransferase